MAHPSLTGIPYEKKHSCLLTGISFKSFAIEYPDNINKKTVRHTLHSHTSPETKSLQTHQHFFTVVETIEAQAEQSSRHMSRRLPRPPPYQHSPAMKHQLFAKQICTISESAFLMARILSMPLSAVDSTREIPPLLQTLGNFSFLSYWHLTMKEPLIPTAIALIRVIGEQADDNSCSSWSHEEDRKPS